MKDIIFLTNKIILIDIRDVFNFYNILVLSEELIIKVNTVTILYSTGQSTIPKNIFGLVAAWLAYCLCNFGVQGSIPGMGAKHFSILSVLSSATFPGQILNFNEKFTL